jgi:hypothetical protein
MLTKTDPFKPFNRFAPFKTFQANVRSKSSKVPVVPMDPVQSRNQKSENVRDVANSPLPRRQKLPSNHIDSFCTPVYASGREIVDQ